MKALGCENKQQDVREQGGCATTDGADTNGGITSNRGATILIWTS